MAGAAAAATAVAIAGLPTTALAESKKSAAKGKGAGGASPLASAQAALGEAWGDVNEDLARMNARLPSRATPLVGTAPSVSPMFLSK